MAMPPQEFRCVRAIAPLMGRSTPVVALASRKRLGTIDHPHLQGSQPMALITKIETGFYRIPLPVTLSDSTHGEITAFELITVRLHDSDGAEGVGYTYTVGRNGGAVADILRREVAELIAGRE